MITKANKQIIMTAARADGVPLDVIHQALALMEDRQRPSQTFVPLAVNQATAARLLSVSRFTIRKLAKEGRLKPVQLCGAVRYNVRELEILAGGSCPSS